MAAVVVVSLQIAPEEAVVEVGDAVQFEAEATMSDGRIIDVTGEVTWICSNNEVAMILEGLATGLSEGNAKITAVLGGLTSNEATLVVTVAAVPTPQPTPPETPTPTLTPTPTAGPTPTPTPMPSPTIEITAERDTIAVGETVQFTATVTYPDGTDVDVTVEATWDSSDTSVATISAGLVTGVDTGTTEITATYDGAMSAPYTLIVTVPAALQWWAILAIIAGLLAAGLFLFFLFRRKGGEQPAEAA
jgi:uncharacterized protein YjdB